MVNLQRAFKVLDKDNDGVLSKEELLQGYQKFYGLEVAYKIVEKIFENADIDGSGEIDYSEWIVATIDKTKLLSDEKLRAAFSLFDKDEGGTISAKEVQEVLCSGQDIDDDVWQRVVQEVDADGDGEIDFGEFKAMMRSMLDDYEFGELTQNKRSYFDDSPSPDKNNYGANRGNQPKMSKAEIMRKQRAQIK